MHALGYRCITAIDISATAIAHMQAADQDKEGVECKRLFTHEVNTYFDGARASGRVHGIDNVGGGQTVGL